MSCAGRCSMRSYCRLCNSVLTETCRLFLNGRLCKLNLPATCESVPRLPLLHTGPRSSKRTSLQIAAFACRLPHEPPCGIYFCVSESESANTTTYQLPRWSRLQCRFRTGKRIASLMATFATPHSTKRTWQRPDNHLCKPTLTRSVRIRAAHGSQHVILTIMLAAIYSTCCRKSWKRSSLG